MNRVSILKTALLLGAALLGLSVASYAQPTERWISHGPYGGSVSVVLPSAEPAGGLYAAVLGHGVYQTATTADTWYRLSDGLDNLYIKALVQNPDDPNILYAGTRNGVYWTTDGGDHWEPRTEGIGSVHVEALAIDPVNPLILYADRWGQVYKTSNAGETWEPTGPGIPSGADCRAILIDPVNTDVLYAATNGDAGVYKTVTGGDEWLPSGNGLLNTDVQSLAFDPQCAQTIYAGCNGNQFVPFGGVYVSHDAGANWDWISNGLPSEIVLNGIAVVYDQAGDIPTIYAAAGYGYSLPMPPGTWEPRLYKSVDHGATWQQSVAGIAYPNLLSIAVDPADPHVIYTGSDCGGVFRSLDCAASWSPWSTGLEKLCVWGVAVHPQNEKIVYAGVSSFDGPMSDRDAGVHVSFDGGVTWEPRLKNMCVTGSYRTLSLAVALCDPEVVYAANCGWNLYKSIDQGLTWQWRGFPHGIDGYWLKCVVVDPENPAIAYVSGAGYEPSYPDVYKTEDCGESWRPIASNLVFAEFMGLAIDPTNPQTVYAGSGWEGVWKTTNGGDSWDLTGEEILGAMVNSIVVDSQNPQRVFAADNGWEATGVYVSYNGGDKWELYNDGLEVLDVETLTLDTLMPTRSAEYPPRLYAGTEGGGAYVREQDAPWIEMNEGLDELRVYGLALGPPHPASPIIPRRALYAGTAQGVYRRIVVGDLDGDGDVDLTDLGILLAHYGMTGGATYEQGDCTGDGDVDLADLGVLLAVYGMGCG